jgi:signal transduction histidine kinase
MKMWKKALIAVAVLTLSIFMVLSAVANLVLLRSFEALEENETRESVARTKNVLSNEFSEMDGKVADWAFWDDTYLFVQGQNPNYVDLNLADSTFLNLRLNLMVFVNSSGQVFYAEAFDLVNRAKVSVPESIGEHVVAHSLLWNHSSTDSKTIGVILLPEQLVLIASKPVLTSNAEGPIEGALIFGRYLDSNEVEYLSKTVGLHLTMNSFNDQQMPADFEIAFSTLSENDPVFVRPLDTNYVAGYSLIKDVYGNDAFVLRVENPRSIYQQGLVTINFFVFSAFVICLVFSVTILILLRLGVLSPLSKLTAAVKELGRNYSTPNHTARLGTDEISLLSHAIKATLSQRLTDITELSGMIGHDLRNPLTGIAGATYYLKTKYASKMDSKGKEMLGIIEDDISYSNKIINDLLEYSGGIKIDLKKTSPKSLIQESLSITPVPENVQLVDLAGDEPALTVDVDKLKRAFTNVIKNAFDAMPDGGLMKISSKKLKRNVEFTFTDTGAGMSKETLEKLWVPLFTTKAKGMGFGLPISKRLVEAHGGSISVTSTIGKGTTVTITIPAEARVKDEVEVWARSPEQNLTSQQTDEA